MNLGRGLFRSWIFLSAVWITVVGVGAYIYLPKKLAGNWGYVAQMRGDIAPWKADWSRPYYENTRSPSLEKLHPEFHVIGDENIDGWNKSLNEGRMEIMHDGTATLYLDAALTKDDQNYLLEEFKKQRWSRWFDAVRYWVLAGFIPPLVVFALGYGALWVARGFKQANAGG
jgi:hypothetical protein